MTENLWQLLKSVLKLGTIMCFHQKSSCFCLFSLYRKKDFYEIYPFAVPKFECKEMFCEHEHRDPSVPADRRARGLAQPNC